MSMTKAQVIEKAKTDGVMDSLVRRVSAMYLLHSTSASILEDTEDYLKENNMDIGKVKWEIQKLNKAFDRYFEKVGGLVGKDQFGNLTEDMLEFEKVVKKFTKLE